MNSKASVALLERLSALAREQFRNEAHVVAVPTLGSPLDAEHLALLRDFDLDRLVDANDLKPLLELSKLVDCIQDGGCQFRGPEQSPGFLSERFRAIVRDVAFARTPIDQQLGQQYARAMSVLYVEPPFVKTDRYEEFTALRSDVEQKDLSLLELRRRVSTASNDVERALLREQIEALESLISESRDLVEALDRQHAFSAAEQTRELAETTATEIPESVSASLATFDLLQITDPDSNESHVRCGFMPAELSDDNWVPIKLTQDEIHAVSSEGRFAAVRQSSAVAQLADDAVTSVELDVQMLAVQRPWFWGGLFENRGWNWRTPRPQLVSDGVDGGDGLIPAYVTGVIVARNLVVKGASALMRSVSAIQPMMTMQARPRPAVRPHFRPARTNAGRSAAVRRPKGTCAVTGTVTSEQGRPLAGAMVILRQEHSHASGPSRDDQRDHRGQRTATGRDGVFELQIAAGASGILTVVMPGFTTWRRSLRVVEPINLPVQLRSEQSTWPRLTVRVQSPVDGEAFAGQSDIHIVSVRGASQHREKLTGVGEVTVGLPEGHYRIEVVAPDAARVTPALRTISLSSALTVDVVIDPGVLLRQSELHLVGFICKRVPKSPNPEEEAEGV
jgi:hypothetical protein